MMGLKRKFEVIDDEQKHANGRDSGVAQALEETLSRARPHSDHRFISSAVGYGQVPCKVYALPVIPATVLSVDRMHLTAIFPFFPLSVAAE